jgi:aminoglycoside phosphotransferase (APT) family kinase protein
MTTTDPPFNITPALVGKLIAEQFPEFAHLNIQPVKIQGHDNRTFRLGPDMLVRMPTEESYALKVPKEQTLLPQLKPHLSVPIPIPLKMGNPSKDFPFPFSIYKWLEGESANSLDLNDHNLEAIALELAKFLKELQSIESLEGPEPGLHNWYRGAHISVYDEGSRTQIAQLDGIIDSNKALKLWDAACQTKWSNDSVWIHGDFATGNILMQNGKLSGIIDFGGLGIGDPACDLVIAWTFLKGKSREIFIKEMSLDADTWLRAKAWALWKATYEVCNSQDKTNSYALKQGQVIRELLKEKI